MAATLTRPARQEAPGDAGGRAPLRERAVGGLATAGAVALAVLAPLGAGYLFAGAIAPSVTSRDFPWVTARALGIAAYLSLTALVLVGTWMRHPWRSAWHVGHGESRLRAHTALGAATIALLAGHVGFLATDAYAGVGWAGAVVPGLAHYRPLAVALGVCSLEVMVAVAATARFAGRRGTRHWLAVHRLSAGAFLLAWAHGVMAGTDTGHLRWMYVITGAVVTVAVASRWVVAAYRGGASRRASAGIGRTGR